jgi:predicted deacylase
MVEVVKLQLHPRLVAAAVIAVLTSLVADGVLTGPWQAIAVAAIAGVSALVVPADDGGDEG